MLAVGYVRPQSGAAGPGGPAGPTDAGGPTGAAGHSGPTGPTSTGANAPGIREIQLRFEQYCRDRGHQLIGIITPEAVTAGTRDPGAGPLADEEQFELLKERCADGPAVPGVVLVVDSSHLASDLDSYVDRVLWLEGLGIEVRCTSSPLADALENGLKLLKPSSRTAVRISRIRDAIASKAGRGEVLGRTPYGYRVGLDGLLEPVEPEAAVVREVFALYTGAAGGAGVASAAGAARTDPQPGDVAAEPGGGAVGGIRGPIGLRRIAAELNGRELRTRAGRPWTTVSLSGILKNPAYIGYYKRRSVRRPANHPAIVDREVFERAQQVVEARRPQRRPRAPEPYLLAGLVACASCGRTMHGLLRERKWKRKDGGEARRSYRYYECPARPRSGPAGGGHASWRAEALEAEVIEQARRAARDTAATAGEPSQWLDLDAGVGNSKGGTGEATGAGTGVQRAIRALRAAIARVAGGSGHIAEFTSARAELRRARSAAAAARPPDRIAITEAIDVLGSADRDAARRVALALVAGVKAGPGAADVQFKVQLDMTRRTSGRPDHIGEESPSTTGQDAR